MTAEQRFERELPELLADLYMAGRPDYVQDVLRQTADSRQRPAWAFPERWLPMNVLTLGRAAIRPIPWRTVGILAVLALLIVLVAVYVGSQSKVPPPFGVAEIGDLAIADQGDIYLIDFETGDRRLLIGGPEIDSGPTFSRDGTKLAFFRGPENARALWVAKSDGSGQREVPTSGLSGVATGLVNCTCTGDAVQWSPDGGTIMVLTSLNATPAIGLVPADGSGPPRVLDLGMAVEGPIWRPPDGREILFRGQTTDGFGLYAVKPDGSGIRPITASNGNLEWDALFFDWSPDGDRVAYQWREGDGKQLIYVVDAAGGQPRSLTTFESAWVAWSPDGSAIATLDELRLIRLIDPDGPAAPRTLQAVGPGIVGWLPTGRELLWIPEAGGPARIVDAAGGPGVDAPFSLPDLPEVQRIAP